MKNCEQITHDKINIYMTQTRNKMTMLDKHKKGNVTDLWQL